MRKMKGLFFSLARSLKLKKKIDVSKNIATKMLNEFQRNRIDIVQLFFSNDVKSLFQLSYMIIKFPEIFS
jgi:hypothetical protein